MSSLLHFQCIVSYIYPRLIICYYCTNYCVIIILLYSFILYHPIYLFLLYISLRNTLPSLILNVPFKHKPLLSNLFGQSISSSVWCFLWLHILFFRLKVFPLSGSVKSFSINFLIVLNFASFLHILIGSPIFRYFQF